MMRLDEFREGAMFRLPQVEQDRPIAGCRNIPPGLFRVAWVGQSVCSRTGKPEWDTAIHAVKVSKSGKQIGRYVYAYAAKFFMEHAKPVAARPGGPTP